MRFFLAKLDSDLYICSSKDCMQMTSQIVLAACLFVMMQGVYSQTPAPETNSLTCGIWSGMSGYWNVQYSSVSDTQLDRLHCGYMFFRDYLSFLCGATLLYMCVIFASGGMPNYWKYIQQSVDAIIYGITFGNCSCSCSAQTPNGNNSCEMWWILQLIIFFFMGCALIAVFPEIAFLYHVFVDLYVLGGSKYSNSESCCCCAKEAQEICCLTVRPDAVDAKKTGQAPPNSTADPSQPLVTGNGASSMFHDPLNLRPRIQYVTKYKPVPMGPSIA